MQAFVYKSLRKLDTYLYLRESAAFGLVPDAVLAPLGRLEFVMELALPAGRQLARVDAQVVRENLAGRGFHLQLPQTQLDPLVAGGVGDG
ncbi:MAG: YcgL domain-containing protein [Arenimonas sp.]